jgi:hypothetical protein
VSSQNIQAICALEGCGEVFTKKTHNHLYHSKRCKREAEQVARHKEVIEDLRKATKREIFPLDHEDQIDEEDLDLIAHLRSENKRLARALTKAKLMKQDLTETVEDVAREVFSSFEVPRVPKPDPDKRRGKEEVAVAVLADWQLGKATRTYNSEVCADRIDYYADEVIRHTNVMRSDHPVRHLRVWILGDIVEGEDIFPGQTNEVDSSLYTQVGVNGPKILGNFLNKMLANFDTVHVVGVIGNHGTLTGGRRNTYDNETNMDRLLYKIMELIYAGEPRITFDIPDGYGSTNFYAVDTIGSYSTLLMHGNQFPAPSAVHGYFKKVMGWKDGAIPEPFQDVAIGHWHHNMKMTLGSSTLRIVGSPESYNEYAQERLAAMSLPSQHLQFVDADYGITSEHTILLDKI